MPSQSGARSSSLESVGLRTSGLTPVSTPTRATPRRTPWARLLTVMLVGCIVFAVAAMTIPSLNSALREHGVPIDKPFALPGTPDAGAQSSIDPNTLGLVEDRDYSFIKKVDRKPIHWECSRPIPVTLIGPAPAVAEDLLAQAVLQVAAASGLPLVVGDRQLKWSEKSFITGLIVVRFVDPTVQEAPGLPLASDRDVAGKGGPRWNDEGTIEAGHIAIRIDGTYAKHTATSTPRAAAILMHEISHAVGLDHAAADADGIMAERGDHDIRLSKGDRFALRQVGCPRPR